MLNSAVGASSHGLPIVRPWRGATRENGGCKSTPSPIASSTSAAIERSAAAARRSRRFGVYLLDVLRGEGDQQRRRVAAAPPGGVGEQPPQRGTSPPYPSATISRRAPDSRIAFRYG